MARIGPAVRSLIRHAIGRIVSEELHNLREQIEAIREDISALEQQVITLSKPFFTRALPKSARQSSTPASIRALRAEFKLTQSDAAELLGVHPRTLAGWEAGYDAPSPENKAALAMLRLRSKEDVWEELETRGKPRPLGPDEIRLIREKAGLSRARFALRLGVTNNTVANWESGRSSPRSSTLTALHGFIENDSKREKGRRDLEDSDPATAPKMQRQDSQDGIEAEVHELEVPDECPDKLRYLRKRLILTQRDLAKWLGVALSAVASMEAGLTAPSPTCLARLDALRETPRDEIYRAVGKTGRSRPLNRDEIFSLRTRLGLTQAELAEQVGVSRTTANNWERYVTRPSGNSLAALHELVERAGISIEDLS